MRGFLVSVLLVGALQAQVLYEEHFTNGAPQLTWQGYFSAYGLLDTLAVENDSTTPEGDGWIGKVFGDAYALQVAGDPALTNYSIEAWIYTIVTPSGSGPYNGLAFRVNPVDSGFYIFAADFDSDRRLRLSYHAPPDFMPTILQVWYDADVPGGLPVTSGWHHFAVNAFGDSISLYFDNILLPGSPIIDNHSTFGMFGVYAASFATTPETKFDALIVRDVPYGVNESSTPQPLPRVRVTPIPFERVLTIRNLPDHPTQIRVFNTAGQLIWQKQTRGTESVIRWLGVDQSQRPVRPGVYFLQIGNQRIRIVKAQ